MKIQDVRKCYPSDHVYACARFACLHHYMGNPDHEAQGHHQINREYISLVGWVRLKCVPLPDTSTKFGGEQDIDLVMTYLIVPPKISDRKTQFWPISI